MRIQHNITALNAANRLKANENTVSKNIQKLSSGYRINSAADDAAGLAVSEKMRKQINGLSQAEDNTQNGISLIQTAEGGLNETSAILQRMNTLAVEASNGTYRVNDRQNLQLEVNSLNTEVNRISSSTKFNEISLLNGDLSTTGSAGAATATIAGVMTGTAQAGKASVTTKAVSDLAAKKATTYTLSYKDASGVTQAKSVTLTWDNVNDKITADNGASIDATGTDHALGTSDVGNALKAAFAANTDVSAAFNVTAATNAMTFQSKTAGTKGEQFLGLAVSPDGGTTTMTAVDSVTAGTDAYTTVAYADQKVYTGSNAAQSVFSVNGTKFAYVNSSVSATDVAKLGNDVNVVYTAGAAPTKSGDATDETATMAALISAKTGLNVAEDSVVANAGMLDFKPGTSSVNGNALVFQVGAENSDDQRASLSIDNMNAASLGLTAIDISDQKGAQAAIDIISKASATVSTTRAQLGALQNELEHTANNLGTMSENLTSAESTIRDVDMTDEYVQYSKNQILSQAANAMLAQANTQPQNVLSLLKG